MNFQKSELQVELSALAKKWAREKLAPLVDQDERDERFRPELIASLGELGLTGIPIEERYGGAGLGYLESTAVLEEIAAVNLGYGISVAVTGLAQVILQEFGSEEQKQEWIPKLAQGQAIGAFSLSEAGAGSNATSLKTSAVRDGSDYLISGTKLWTTQGDSADVLMVMARTGEEGPKGISTFIVRKGAPGFSLGKREHKMGCHTSHTMELVFDRVRVPESDRVGVEGQGNRVALQALDSGRITIAACAVGIARSALEVATQHANEREQFGKAIGEFQGISFMLADMWTKIEASRLLLQRAASLKDAGQPFSHWAAQAKLFATDTAMQVTTDAVQILGGSGYTQEFPVERHMREAKMLQIVEGTNQIQRMILGKTLLKQFRELL
jgi:alkylation response protein AidB-like acyl-CoA dehydrogenase